MQEQNHTMRSHGLRQCVELPISERENEVLEVYTRAAGALTDRQIATALRKTDLNYVRPTITRLLQRHILEEHGDRVDPDTSRVVRMLRVKPALANYRQRELF